MFDQVKTVYLEKCVLLKLETNKVNSSPREELLVSVASLTLFNVKINLLVS